MRGGSNNRSEIRSFRSMLSSWRQFSIVASLHFFGCWQWWDDWMDEQRVVSVRDRLDWGVSRGRRWLSLLGNGRYVYFLNLFKSWMTSNISAIKTNCLHIRCLLNHISSIPSASMVCTHCVRTRVLLKIQTWCGNRLLIWKQRSQLDNEQISLQIEEDAAVTSSNHPSGWFFFFDNGFAPCPSVSFEKRVGHLHEGHLKSWYGSRER